MKITRQVEIGTECFFDDGGGIGIDCYIGDSSEPVICELHSFRELIEDYVESILNTEGKLSKHDCVGIKTMLSSLEEALSFAKYVAAEKGYGEYK